jgi:poly-gamma-glutamate capsule biosynthesis protein CapA/YwtB (metallophosphatase superfamily)
LKIPVKSILLVIIFQSTFVFSHKHNDSSRSIIDTVKAINDSSGTRNHNSKIISFIGVGDIMMGTDYPDSTLPPSDGKYLMNSLKDILTNADITFGNLEGVLLDDGVPEKVCKDTSKCYIFRTPSYYVDNLDSAGFNLMSLANNHSFDFGIDGYKSSEELLSTKNILSAGRSGSYSIFEVLGIKVGFVAFAPNKGCTSINDLDAVSRKIKNLDEHCDMIIVSFHGGAEGINALHVKNETEFFYGEKRGNVVEFARTAIDAGGDLIIGHGPHVPRAVDLYKNKFIAYSLGNFCTYGKFNLRNERGYSPILKLAVNENGDFLYGEIISARQYYPGGPFMDENRGAQKLIEKLTKTDFPGTSLQFDPDGWITIKE